jgi:hypothetical protein
MKKGWFWWGIIFAAALIAGINLGEPAAVLEKARAICLSCIGIQ